MIKPGGDKALDSYRKALVLKNKDVNMLSEKRSLLVESDAEKSLK